MLKYFNLGYLIRVGGERTLYGTWTNLDFQRVKHFQLWSSQGHGRLRGQIVHSCLGSRSIKGTHLGYTDMVKEL